jgi:GntR family transcriptional regulator
MTLKASSSVSPITSDSDRVDGIFDGQSGMSRYVQLASVLRHRIAAGEWQIGQRLPTVQQLAEDFGLAKVTVRQAFALLAREKLITVQRARGTFVSGEPSKPSAGLHAAINDMHVGSRVFAIQLLEIRSNLNLPVGLCDGAKVAEKYVCVRKLHLHDGEPFCLAEIYVLASLFKKFPKGGEKRYKIARLVREADGPQLGIMRQTMTVEPADYDLSRLLSYSFAAPVALIKRVSYATDHSIVTAGLSWYRGDRFVLDMELPSDMTTRYPAIAIPNSRRSAPGKASHKP